MHQVSANTQAAPLSPGQVYAWHSLDATEVAALLQTSPHGLTREEATRRLESFGPNEIRPMAPPNNLAILARQFRNPLIYILVAATLVTIALEEFIDAAAISAALGLNATIGFFQERRAEYAVRALMSLVSPKARVIRENREWEVDSRAVVPGDVVFLESGSRVPADMRLFSATALTVDESLLTGESVTVTKSAQPVPEKAGLGDRSCMAFMGTIVSTGRGRGYVVATGRNTQLGSIAEEMRREERVATPLQERMATLARFIGAAVVTSAALVFIIGLAIGETASQMLLTAVAVAVGAVPEGLPAVMTIALAIGVRRMARRNAIIRRLSAAETLGSTTVIASDKTGTLTENRMTVVRVWAGGLFTDAAALKPPIRSPLSSGADPLYLTLLAGVLTNEAEVYQEEGRLQVSGDPTEGALLVSAEAAGIDTREVRETYHTLAEIPFEPERQYSASYRELNGQHYVFVKGAPERLISMSNTMLLEQGEREIDPHAVRDAASRLAGDGLRVLAMAYKRLPERPDNSGKLAEPSDLVFLGLQGMTDPPRPGVREAIAGCRRAGIRVLMITGDHPDTAIAIGRELGIASSDDAPITGGDLDQMAERDLIEIAARAPVFARISPEGKLRIVQALRRRGEVVAVTGDGVNDAPALKAADIGIAMGRSGTDVAREAADMVLADDNFVSIYAAVEEGRVTFENVRKVTFFLISTGAALIFLILLAPLLGWPLPLLPTQIVWLNLVTNGLQDVALAFEPGERNVLARPPRRKTEGIVSRLLWERTIISGIVMGAGTLVAFRWSLDQGGSLEEARTVALTTMVLFQAFHIGNSRSEFLSAFQKNPISNPFLFLSAAAALSVHVGALYFPPSGDVLRVEPITIAEWLLIIPLAASIILAVEAHKFVRRTSSVDPDSAGFPAAQ